MATGTNGSFAFSNFSPTYVWIAAPGTNGILSTSMNNSYIERSGTSMAAPVVAGAAAMLVGAYRARGIAYTPADVINLLTDSATPPASKATAMPATRPPSVIAESESPAIR